MGEVRWAGLLGAQVLGYPQVFKCFPRPPQAEATMSYIPKGMPALHEVHPERIDDPLRVQGARRWWLWLVSA